MASFPGGSLSGGQERRNEHVPWTGGSTEGNEEESGEDQDGGHKDVHRESNFRVRRKMSRRTWTQVEDSLAGEGTVRQKFPAFITKSLTMSSLYHRSVHRQQSGARKQWPNSEEGGVEEC